MITVRLKGGMGNQMFQYAFGLARAISLGVPLQMDLSALLDRSRNDIVHRNYDLSIFNIKEKLAQYPGLLRNIYKFKSAGVNRIVRKNVEKGKFIVKEKHFHFDSELIIDIKNNTLFEGWFQSHKYFSNIESDLRKHFSFKRPVINNSTALLSKIENGNAICLNVRRTDFLKVDTLNTTNLTYFNRAAKKMSELVEQPEFFIFSDDMTWCRENLNLEFPTTFVGHEHKGEKFGNYMQLMSRCQHFIIPNSSFAWWAVWMAENSDKKVIAPKNWFNDKNIDTSDLVPEEWLRI